MCILANDERVEESKLEPKKRKLTRQVVGSQGDVKQRNKGVGKTFEERSEKRRERNSEGPSTN